MASAMVTARRLLLGLNHVTNSHAHEADADHAMHEADHEVHESTLDVRIAAIFAIAAGALLCGLPPLFLRAFQSPDSPVARGARAFSGGIILALALIHIVPEAVMELSEVVSYPIGGITVLGGILVMIILESSLTALWSPKGDQVHSNHHHHNDMEASIKDTATHKDTDAAAPDAAAAHPPAAHAHACTSSLTAQRWLGPGGAGSAMAGVRAYVTAYTMELGCIFHSVIIGVGVGVITEDRHLVIVLLVALVIHQGLEGLSLGTVLALTPFSKVKKVIMVAMYAVTTSIGIAIGIGLASTYDHNSVASKVVQGTLNGVSGGMLIYISLLQLIAEEFSRADLLSHTRLRLGLTSGLLLGAACMAVLAIWS